MQSTLNLILPKETPDIPLYKYYSNINHAVDAIENNRIHLDQLSKFNDLYEGAFPIPEDYIEQIANPPANFFTLLRRVLDDSFTKIIDDFEVAIKKIEDIDSIFLTDFIECANTINPENGNKIRDAFSKLFNNQEIMVADNYRISCFSEVNDSLLMWAYYANKYEGVCVQFDVTGYDLLYQGLRRVAYTDLYYGNYGEIGNYFRKSSQWQHEKEWRIVCQTTEEYIPAKVTGVFFTKRLRKEHRDVLKDLAMKNSIDLVYLYPSRNKYELKQRVLIEKGILKEPKVYL